MNKWIKPDRKDINTLPNDKRDVIVFTSYDTYKITSYNPIVGSWSDVDFTKVVAWTEFPKYNDKEGEGEI